MPDHTMDVTVNTEDQTALIVSSKFKSRFHVYKPRDQTFFFRIKLDLGTLPEVLQGRFSSLNKAVEICKHYIETAEETFAKKSDRLHQDRQERNAAKLEPKDSQLV